ncbi:hypothetical protein BCR34DRAFT_584424 [Clohesyomyces aquaticus]|uniref:Uncharacterized protein n=1 Tax=Clohesyomyces aquaticus TaxID=1231657 RepID=A0A1Y2A1V8_9PLEO|nr:hypothetical protein BCR34DRAFT_584424 [Clohesyomyces aquaticus]
MVLQALVYVEIRPHPNSPQSLASRVSDQAYQLNYQPLDGFSEVDLSPLSNPEHLEVSAGGNQSLRTKNTKPSTGPSDVPSHAEAQLQPPAGQAHLDESSPQRPPAPAEDELSPTLGGGSSPLDTDSPHRIAPVEGLGVEQDQLRGERYKSGHPREKKRQHPVNATPSTGLIKDLVVQPFGGLRSPMISTPVPNTQNGITETPDFTEKPTCSLNLVYYSKTCKVSQIRVTTRGRFSSDESYQKAFSKTPTLISTDEEFFLALRHRYRNEICGFWQRSFGLKSLVRLRLLSYTESARPTPVPLDDFTMQEVLYAYNHPAEFGSETDWIEWVFRLRQPDKRHALEFVEGWNGSKIAFMGLIPCVASTLVGVIWTARGGDAQTAFTVAGFILTVTTECWANDCSLAGALAVISGIESASHHTSTQLVS